MLFNSLDFPIFFLGVVLVFWALPQRLRWVLLLAASYWFYAAWKPEYLLLIWLSTASNYAAGLAMGARSEKRERRPWLACAIVGNLALLATFKYLDFFGAILQDVFDLVRIDVDVPLFHLLLPVGISFYTFQSLSYAVDVYRGRRPPERHLGIFALYVAFFPQLVAGPIERSTRLLPQFHQPVRFDPVRARDGLALMLFGFFKKCVIADRVAIYVDGVYAEPGGALFEGFPSLLATYLFMWQGYCDFSGYSDIAIGAAAVLGYRLMENFRRPFLAVSIRDFWSRWHISLISWFRDYVYAPLTRPGMTRSRLAFNLVFVFTLSGLWHGATWNCVLWGTVNGVFLWVGDLTRRAKERIATGSGLARFPRVRHLFDVLVTYHLVAVGLMLFRTQSLHDFAAVFESATRPIAGYWRLDGPLVRYELGLAFVAIALLLAIEIVQERRKSTLIVELGRRPRWIRWPVYYALVFTTLMFGEFNMTPFFYFQF